MTKISIKKQNRGFTLVETLVAITILMIAIAGPLSIANRAYHAAIDSKNQTIAYNLAQEMMEYIKNRKDNNASTFINTLGAYCSNSECEMDLDDFMGGSNPSICSLGCKLYVNDKGYTYSSASGKVSPFKRVVTITLPSSNVPYTEGIVNVIVSWNTGTLSNQVKLQEYMTASSR